MQFDPFLEYQSEQKELLTWSQSSAPCPLVKELRGLWATREQRSQSCPSVGKTCQEVKNYQLSLYMYNIFHVHPSYFAKTCVETMSLEEIGSEDEVEGFSCGYVPFGRSRTFGSRKDPVKKIVTCEYDEQFVKKMGRPRKKEEEKKYVKKSMVKGRPKSSKNKSSLQILMEQEKTWPTSTRYVYKMLRKPFKLKPFKNKEYKIKKKQWKDACKIVEKCLQKKLKKSRV